MNSQTFTPPSAIATAPSLLEQLRRAASQWIHHVQETRRARAALYLELQALRQLDGATRRDLGLGESSLTGSERRWGDRPLKTWE